MAERIIRGEAFNIVVEGREGAPAVVLAHPLGADLHLFDKLVPALLRHFRIIRYDMRGHGSSVVTPGSSSLDQLGRDAVGILDAVGFRKVHWIGVSLGGMVGLWLLIHARERINRAVLANVAAQLGNPDLWNERIRTVEEKGMEGLAPSVLQNWFTRSFRERHPDEVERISEILLATPEEGYTAACAAIRDMDLRETIRGITNPVLVIVGRHDPLTTPGLGALVASAVQGAKLVTLDTAHMSCIEDPEGFDQAAIKFLTTEAPVMGDETKHDAGSGSPNAPQPLQRPLDKPRVPSQPATSGLGGGLPSHGISHPAPVAPRPPVPAAPAAAAPAKKKPAKKSAAKKSAAKKTARKSAAKKATKKTARKSAAKKGTRRVAKKSSARKRVVKKTQAKKGARKGAAKKAGRKAQPRRKAGRRTPGRKR